MVVARQVFGDALVGGRKLQAAALRQLAHVFAVHLLPRRLVVQLRCGPSRYARLPLVVWDLGVECALVQIKPHTVAGLQIRKAAAHDGFRGRIQDLWFF